MTGFKGNAFKLRCRTGTV